MKIKDSKLELERLESLDNVSEVMKRKDLRYKTLYAVFPKTISPEFIRQTVCAYKSFKGDYTLTADQETLLSYYKEVYVITKSNVKESKISYTEEEKKVLVSILLGTIKEYKLDTAELICHAIGNKKLLQTFYSDYGKMEETCKLCSKLRDEGEIKSLKDTSKLFPHQYQRARYSIYELVRDLVNSKAYICTDPDLMAGKYERISRTTKKTSEPVRDSWNLVISSKFNKNRANLNLNYLSTVKVDVPENEFGVESGLRELKTIKSICLVKDGKVCNTSFGIRIKSDSLYRKLRSAGIIKGNLVYKGDYMIDITNLPVLSKSRMGNIRSFDLGMAEVWYKLCDISLEYLRRREYKERMKLTTLPEKLDTTEKMSDAELYLAKLGIYGDYFYPDKKVGVVKKIYDTIELVPSTKHIPTKETCTKNITKILNGVRKSNEFVNDFLNSYVIPDIDKGIGYKELISTWERRKNAYRNEIQELKFRLISGKSLEVCVHGCPKTSILKTTQLIKLPGLEKYVIPVTWTLKKTHVIV